MDPLDFRTDFSPALGEAPENELSRRCLRILLRWIPYGMRQWNTWPGRPRCGHFFGGVLWYCQDTVMPAFALAAATTSDEYDESLAGYPKEHIRDTVVQALRYACFTHDTGPEDCVRPTESWGRTEPAGKKWGERGAGFFRETNAGRQVANLMAIASLVRDGLGDEESAMVATIARDYLGRFIDMPPANGLYYNTQMEENAWTAFGLTGAALLLEKDPSYPEWEERIRRWMFLTVSKPEDMHDHSEGYDGKTVRQLTAQTFTALPDNTAENHGFVHPSYMKSCLTLLGQMTVLRRLWGKEIPEAAYHHVREIYDVLKTWVDETGSCHAPQGMDWPFLGISSHCLAHGMAALNLGDPDGALLERRSLAELEAIAEAHDGQLIPAETKRACHGQQDPAFMRERFISHIAYLYLAHRLAGPGPEPSREDEFARRIQGVHVYNHGGSIIHVHPAGRSSFSWRNGSMVLPSTGEGLRLIGHARNSVLARLEVTDKQQNAATVCTRIRDHADHVSALLVEDLYERSIRRRVLFASLPDGRAVVWEHLEAIADVTVRRVLHGYLSVMNDPTFAPAADTHPRRRISWHDGSYTAEGYAGESDAEDETVSLGDGGWVNVDDRFGIVFRATGSGEYRNLHRFPVWHATENELVLGRHEPGRTFEPGEEIGRMTLLWLPDRSSRDTAAAELHVTAADAARFVAQVDGATVAANFDDVPMEVQVPGDRPVQLGGVWLRGGSGEPGTVTLGPLEPLVVVAGPAT
jgi:hypothetical protein